MSPTVGRTNRVSPIRLEPYTAPRVVWERRLESSFAGSRDGAPLPEEGENVDPTFLVDVLVDECGSEICPWWPLISLPALATVACASLHHRT